MNGHGMGGPARIHPTTFVAPGAIVVGDVTLAARTSVWFNTVVRADSATVTVGEDTNLQDNSVVHEDEGLPTVIGARVTVGHRSIIHGCVIEDECLIGMGSVVLSGARIGAGSLIGAGALVREGQVIAPASLAVGAPARLIGQVTEAHRTSIRNGWSHYAELAGDYLRRGHAHPLDRSGAILGAAPPISGREWDGLLRMMEEFPDRVLRMMTEDPSAPSHDAVVHGLMARDRLVRLDVLDRLAAGEDAVVGDAIDPGSAADGGSWRARVAKWMPVRARLCARLEGLDPRSGLRAVHPTRGPFSLPCLVREWIDEDLDECRRLGSVSGSGP